MIKAIAEDRNIDCVWTFFNFYNAILFVAFSCAAMCDCVCWSVAGDDALLCCCVLAAAFCPATVWPSHSPQDVRGESEWFVHGFATSMLPLITACQQRSLLQATHVTHLQRAEAPWSDNESNKLHRSQSLQGPKLELQI